MWNSNRQRQPNQQFNVQSPMQGKASTGTGPMAPNTAQLSGPGIQAGGQLNSTVGTGYKPTSPFSTSQGGYNNAGGQGAMPPTGSGDIDAETQALVSKYLNPDAQNAADQARLEKEQQALVGQNLANARAAGGRSGLGVGAQQAAEGDVERKSQMDLADQIAAARQQNTQNAFSAGNLDINERNAANQQAALQAQLDYLKAVLGGQPKAQPPPTDPAAGVNQAATGIAAGVNPAEAVAGKNVGTVTPPTDDQKRHAKTVSSPPAGAQLQSSDGRGNYYKDAQGNWYYVRNATMKG